MARPVRSLGPALALLLLAAASPAWQTLGGTIGASKHFGSGWIDLAKVANFHRGDMLRLRVGGTAEQIVVRLAAKGDDPNDPAGVDGGMKTVPPNRIVVVTLEDNHENVKQISVHGGPNPWGVYNLGPKNGPATLQSVQHK